MFWRNSNANATHDIIVHWFHSGFQCDCLNERELNRDRDSCSDSDSWLWILKIHLQIPSTELSFIGIEPIKERKQTASEAVALESCQHLTWICLCGSTLNTSILTLTPFFKDSSWFLTRSIPTKITLFHCLHEPPDMHRTVQQHAKNASCTPWKKILFFVLLLLWTKTSPVPDGK